MSPALPIRRAVVAGALGPLDPDVREHVVGCEAVRALASWLVAALGPGRVHRLLSRPRPGEHRATSDMLRAAVVEAAGQAEPGTGLLVYLAAPTVVVDDDIFLLLDDGLAAMPESSGVSLRWLAAELGRRAGSATLVTWDGRALPLSSHRPHRPELAMEVAGEVVMVFSTAPEVPYGIDHAPAPRLARFLRDLAGEGVGADTLAAGLPLRAGSSVGGVRRESVVWASRTESLFTLPPPRDDLVTTPARLDLVSSEPEQQPEQQPERQPEPEPTGGGHPRRADLSALPSSRRRLAEELAGWLSKASRELQPAMTLIVGPAGVGKDHLLDTTLSFCPEIRTVHVRLRPRDRRLPFRPVRRLIRALVDVATVDEPDGPPAGGAEGGDLVDAVSERLRRVPLDRFGALGLDGGPLSRERLLAPLRVIGDLEAVGRDILPPIRWSRAELRLSADLLARLSLLLAGSLGVRCFRFSDLELRDGGTTAWLDALLHHAARPGLAVVASTRSIVTAGLPEDVPIRRVEVAPLDRADGLELLVERMGHSPERAEALHAGLLGLPDAMVLAAALGDLAVAIAGRGKPPVSAGQLHDRMVLLLEQSLSPGRRALLQAASFLDQPIDPVLLAHLLDRMDVGDDLDRLGSAGVLVESRGGWAFSRRWIADELRARVDLRGAKALRARIGKGCRGRLVGRLLRGPERRRVWEELASTPDPPAGDETFLGPVVHLGRALRSFGLERPSEQMAAKVSWVARVPSPSADPQGELPAAHAQAFLWMSDLAGDRAEMAQIYRLSERARALAKKAGPHRARIEAERAVIVGRQLRARGDLEASARAVATAPTDEIWWYVEALRTRCRVPEDRLDEALATPSASSSRPHATLTLRLARAERLLRVSRQAAERRASSSGRGEKAALRGPPAAMGGILEEAWGEARKAGSAYHAARALLALADHAEWAGALLDAPIYAMRAIGAAVGSGDLLAEAAGWELYMRAEAAIRGSSSALQTLSAARNEAIERGWSDVALLRTLVLAEQARGLGKERLAAKLIARLLRLPRVRALGWMHERLRKLSG